MPGDTTASLAKAEAVEPSLITYYNMLAADTPLTPGQSIQIPCARILQYAQQLKAFQIAVPASEPAG